MAHFARLNNTGGVISIEVVVNEVITDASGNEQEQLGIDFLTNLYSGGWYKQTSYNNTFRKNFAGAGFTYDGVRDAFIPSQPYPSWVLNDTSCQWEAPIANPEEGHYRWDEETTNWKEII
jgi:hypothetical protein